VTDFKVQTFKLRGFKNAAKISFPFPSKNGRKISSISRCVLFLSLELQTVKDGWTPATALLHSTDGLYLFIYFASKAHKVQVLESSIKENVRRFLFQTMKT
jgi:hypothetical protein